MNFRILTYIYFQVLHDSLNKLNNWEKEIKSKKISKDEFLTSCTAEGFRVSILSTIKLCEYLLALPEFKYVLTAKVNQDRLEVCILLLKRLYRILF